MHAMRFRLSVIGRLLLGSIVTSFLLLAAARPAQAAVPPAWFVIDAESGQVLAARNADALHYPASLTKLMTLYLVFDGLEQKQLTLGQTFSVSRHAADQEPTKIGLRRGERISIHDLILALVTQSANDAAVVLGEGIAGSEAGFAERMSAQAKERGMTQSVFRNASGLPNRHQVTSARDMARLARALIRDFPDDYKYFSVKRFHYRGRTFLNHDRLIYRYQGADGMKTGFTNAARFNLVSSAMRDDPAFDPADPEDSDLKDRAENPPTGAERSSFPLSSSTSVSRSPSLPDGRETTFLVSCCTTTKSGTGSGALVIWVTALASKPSHFTPS